MDDKAFGIPIRGRRIMARERMRDRAIRRFSFVFLGPSGCPGWNWMDLDGVVRNGQKNWDDVFAMRRKQGVLLANNLAYCSRYCCSNPRLTGDLTIQELRAEASALDQLRCEGI